MMDNKMIRIEAARQKRSTLTAEVLQNGEAVEKDGVRLFVSEENTGNCRLGGIDLRITNAWVSENTPQKITVNGKDMTDSAICKGGLINHPMEEKSGQKVVTIS